MLITCMQCDPAQIVTANRTYYLAAADGESCGAWRSVLADVCFERIPNQERRTRIVKSFDVKIIEAKDLYKTGMRCPCV